MTNHEEMVVERIRADHRPIKIPGQRRKVCAVDGRPAPCSRLRLADDIEAGRRDVHGAPLIDPVPWRDVIRQGWPSFLLVVVLAAAFGWPGLAGVAAVYVVVLALVAVAAWAIITLLVRDKR